ncbi:MAG: hypothetical protein ABSC48_06695 [Terracidiphilus sp.]|jgi:hypothetical protein
MQRYRLPFLLGLLLTAICVPSGAYALGTSPVSITATSVTMPSSGNGESHYTVIGIPASGTVMVDCLFTGTITTARIPNCTYGPINSTPVTAGQILTGTIEFYPFGAAAPVGLHKTPRHSGHLPAAGLALAGVLMLGFGVRRGRRRWFALVLFAAGALAGLGGISGCGGPSTSMTPGTYQYTITASYEDTGSPALSAIVSTTVEVTVP